MALPEGIPERTLGWGVLEWCTNNLVQPDRDDKGEPWVFKPDQARFILWFYAVDESGRFLYRRAYRERAKGTGKSPMVAALAAAEFLGPVKFSHFDVNGQAVGKRNHDSWVQLAAVSEKQCKGTYSFIIEMMARCAGHYGVELGLTKIQLIGGGPTRVIEMVTNNHRSQEGLRPTFAIFEESQHWVPSEKGPEFAQTIRRNLRKTGGRDIEVTNAPEPGVGTVAELTHEFQKKIEEGKAIEKGLLFDTFAVRVDDIYDRDQAMPALELMYKDAPWADLEAIFGEICDPSTREVDARRFYFNEMVQPSEMWISQKVWEAAQRNTKLKKSDLISLGFRVRKNCAAIVAVRLKDQAVFVLEKWERPGDAGRDWEVPYAKIDGKMRRILDRYNVYNVVASPENFQDIIGRWSVDYESDVVIEELWVSRSRQKWADSIELFETAVADQRITHDGDLDLTRQVMNAFVDVVTQGRVIRMETTHSHRYIVLAEAAVLAARASMEAIEDGALKEGPDNVLFSF